MLTPTTEHQMGMGIHQTGSDQLTLGINHLSTGEQLSRNLTLAHSGNLTILADKISVLENGNLALLLARARAEALGRSKEADIGNYKAAHFASTSRIISRSATTGTVIWSVSL